MTQASKFDLPPARTGFNHRFIVLKYPLDALETVVAATFAVPVIDLRAGSRGSAAVAFARQSAMYLAHIAFGLSYAEVGRMFGRDRTTAAYACRLVEERGVAETIRVATKDEVEFRELSIPERFYPSGGHARESWRSLFYANLVKDFIDEILEGGDRSQGGFEDGAWVQETINAVELSFHERRWVSLPLGGP